MLIQHVTGTNFLYVFLFISEQKRREKLARKEAEKKEKDQQKVNKQPASTDNTNNNNNAETNEDTLDPTVRISYNSWVLWSILLLYMKQYKANRTKLLNEYEAQGNNPWPHKFHVTISVPDFINKYKHLEKDQTADDQVSLAGIIIYTIVIAILFYLTYPL